jgi:hypothetical protein
MSKGERSLRVYQSATLRQTTPEAPIIRTTPFNEKRQPKISSGRADHAGPWRREAPIGDDPFDIDSKFQAR